jgi:hypothetical protein
VEFFSRVLGKGRAKTLLLYFAWYILDLDSRTKGLGMGTKAGAHGKKWDQEGQQAM